MAGNANAAKSKRIGIREERKKRAATTVSCFSSYNQMAMNPGQSKCFSVQTALEWRLKVVMLVESQQGGMI